MGSFNFIELLNEYYIKYKIIEDNYLLIEGTQNLDKLNMFFIERIDENFPYNIYFYNFDKLWLDDMQYIPKHISIKFEKINGLYINSLKLLPDNAEFISVYHVELKKIENIDKEQKIHLRNTSHILFSNDLLNVAGTIYVKDKMPYIDFGKQSIVSGSILLYDIKHVSIAGRYCSCIYGGELEGLININLDINDDYNAIFKEIQIAFRNIKGTSIISVKSLNENKELNLNIYAENVIHSRLYIENIPDVIITCDELSSIFSGKNIQKLIFHQIEKIHLKNSLVRTMELIIRIKDEDTIKASGNGTIETDVLYIKAQKTNSKSIYDILKNIKNNLLSMSLFKYGKINVLDNNASIKSILLDKYDENKSFICFLKRV